MANKTKSLGIPPKLLAKLEEALRDAYERPDLEAMKKACKQMDRMREETRKKTGDLDIAVDLIRDARNQ